MSEYQEAAELLDAVERAVGQILQDTYNGRADDERGMMEAEIGGFIRHQLRTHGLPDPTEIKFDKGWVWDDEKKREVYSLHAHVLLPPEAKDISIEIVKILRRRPSVDGAE